MTQEYSFEVGDKVSISTAGYGFPPKYIGIETTILEKFIRGGQYRYAVKLPEDMPLANHEHIGAAGESFELMESNTVKVSTNECEKLTLSVYGITITLDPSIPFSRKFAEVFLDVVYERAGK